MVNPPEDVIDAILKRTIIYPCKSVTANKIMDPPMDEVLSVLNSMMASVKYRVKDKELVESKSDTWHGVVSGLQYGTTNRPI